MAIDLLTGSAAIRSGIERGLSLPELEATWVDGERRFAERRKPYLLYP